jgi:O-antigen/teichoic acid export membrane protein
MQKKFISNLFLMVVLNLLVKPIAIFGIDATVQNRVGAEDYGIYFSLLNFSLLFNILLDFGINNFTTKNIAQYPNIAVKYIGKVLTFRMVLFVLYAVFSFSVALILGWNEHELSLLGLLVFNQFIVSLIAYIRSHFSGLLLFKTEAVVSVLDRLLLILFCGYLLYMPNDFGPFQIEWFIWIQTLCYLLTLFISFVLLFRRMGLPEIKYNRAFSYAIIRKSFPYALLILLMMIYTRTDSVMVERIHVNGKAEAGYYAQGFRLFNALFTFAMIFSSLLFPIFSKMLKEKSNVIPLFNMSSILLVGGSLSIALLCTFNSEYILGLIYREDIAYSSLSFPYIMLGFVGMCGTVIFGTLLTARGNLRFLNTVSGIGIGLNVILNLTLIPDMGAEGAAIATLGTQSAVAFAQFIYCYKLLNLKFNLNKALAIFVFIGGLLAFYYYIPVNTIWLLIATLAFPLALMFILRLLDIRQLTRLILPKQ